MFAVLFALVASVPMIMHVYPQSECLLFSSENNSKLYYGHWACELLAVANALNMIYNGHHEMGLVLDVNI